MARICGDRRLLRGAIIFLAALFCVACAAETLIRGGSSDGEEEVEVADEDSSSSSSEVKPVVAETVEAAVSAEEEEAAEVEETPAEAVEAPSTGKSAGANETAEEVAPPPEEKTVSLDEYLANKEGMTLDLSSLRIGVRKDAVKVEAAVEEEAVEGEEEEYYEEGVEGEEYEEYYEEEEEAKVVELDGVPALQNRHGRHIEELDEFWGDLDCLKDRANTRHLEKKPMQTRTEDGTVNSMAGADTLRVTVGYQRTMGNSAPRTAPVRGGDARGRGRGRGGRDVPFVEAADFEYNKQFRPRGGRTGFDAEDGGRLGNAIAGMLASGRGMGRQTAGSQAMFVPFTRDAGEYAPTEWQDRSGRGGRGGEGRGGFEGRGGRGEWRGGRGDFRGRGGFGGRGDYSGRGGGFGGRGGFGGNSTEGGFVPRGRGGFGGGYEGGEGGGRGGFVPRGRGGGEYVPRGRGGGD
ncbi:hypothetical protein T484DRAFT_1889890, partial [Baffinella frigidus]